MEQAIELCYNFSIHNNGQAGEKMKYSVRLSDAVHMMIYIEVADGALCSSAAIAESIKTNPAYVRQLMMKLRKAGLLQSVHGHAMPRLARQPEKISLLDVYKAVEGDKPLLHLDANINPSCDIGVNIQYALKGYYEQIQEQIEREMAQIKLSDVMKDFLNVYQQMSKLQTLSEN